MTKKRKYRRPEFVCPEATRAPDVIDTQRAPTVRFVRASEDPVAVLAPLVGQRVEWRRCPAGLVRVPIR
jgi:hypothetical protein